MEKYMELARRDLRIISLSLDCSVLQNITEKPRKRTYYYKIKMIFYLDTDTRTKFKKSYSFSKE